MKKQVFFLVVFVWFINGPVVGMNSKKKMKAEKVLKQMEEESQEWFEEPWDPWGEEKNASSKKKSSKAKEGFEAKRECLEKLREMKEARLLFEEMRRRKKESKGFQSLK